MAQEFAIQAFSLISLAVFVVLVTLAGFRMVWRLGNFLFYGYPVPVLLKRDIVLFGSLGTYFGTALVALILNVGSGLGHEPLWIVPRGLMVLLAMAYWVKVEYGIDDATDDKRSKK